jgi:hypothetical protein
VSPHNSAYSSTKSLGNQTFLTLISGSKFFFYAA